MKKEYNQDQDDAVTDQLSDALRAAGYQNVTILWGATKGDDIHCHLLTPDKEEKEEDEYDIRLLMHEMQNCYFGKYEQNLKDQELNP